MRTRGRVKAQLNAFLRFATDVKAQLRTRAALSLKMSHRHPFTRRLDGTHAHSGYFGEEKITALCWKHSHDFSDVAVLFQLYWRPRIQITAQGAESLTFSTDRSISNSLFYQLDAQVLYFFNTFITFLYMFRALLCLSSGGQIVLIQHLVSSLSLGDCSVHRVREDSSWFVL